MLELSFTWLLLPACMVFGWALGIRRRRSGPHSSGDSPAGQRIAETLDDVSDEAIEVLTRAAEAAPAAIELQLTLGALFRQRGELDRAIHLHESAAASPELSDSQRARARLALAEDFLKAGVMDRAEELAIPLIEEGALAGDALALLLNLHEQARDWPQAIATALRWQSVQGVSAAPRIAQYHCELAEAARFADDIRAATEAASRALSIDHACVRASILLGAIEETREAPAEAFAQYRRVLDQDPVFIGEVLDRARDCCTRAATPELFEEFLEDANAIPEVAAEISLVKARWLADTGQDAAAYLADELRQRPSERGLLLWLELSGRASEDERGDWIAIRERFLKMLAARPRYRCQRCGLTPSALFWQCPSCKSWVSIRPN